MVNTVVCSHRVVEIRHCLVFTKQLFSNFESFVDNFGALESCAGSVVGKKIATKKFHPGGNILAEMNRLKDFWPSFSSGNIDMFPTALKETNFYEKHLKENISLG